MDENQDIHKLIDEIVIAQSRMTKEDRLKRYAASLYMNDKNVGLTSNRCFERTKQKE